MTVARALGVRLKTLSDITVPCGAPSEESDEASRAELSVDMMDKAIRLAYIPTGPTIATGRNKQSIGGMITHRNTP